MPEPIQRERYHAQTLPNGALSQTERAALQREFKALQRSNAPTRREAYGTAAPTVDTWTRGDVTWNLEPSVLGTPGSEYVVQGWVCTTSGTPGTWVAMHALTGT